MLTERLKILVTGGAGFIGSHVAEAYSDDGHDVVVVDDLRTGSLAFVPDGVRFHRLAVESDEFLRLVERERFDVVNHHAAQKSVPRSVADPAEDALVNVLAFVRLLQAAAQSGVARVVFASTGGALSGSPDGRPVSEDAPPSLASPYAIGKYAAERYLLWFAEQGAFVGIALRYGNVYGPRQKPEGECGVVPIFLDDVQKGRPSRLYTYPDMPRGTSRDYVFVGDVVEANRLALISPESGVFNIGSGVETFTLDLYEAIAKVAGVRPGITREPPRPGDVRRSCLDIARARRILGWEPRTPLEEGLRRTLLAERATHH